ncbi:MAG: hypothetical protein K2J65_06350 [Duncaniella sp.]|nr:hypothetical protein [Duncaniella sp.]
MSEETRDNGTKDVAKRPRRKWWVKTLIGVGIALGVIVVLFLAAITVAVSYLKPERLTPLVTKLANEHLDAKVSLDRVELSFWSTFPKFELDVRGLQVQSNALDKLPADAVSKLPAYADSLAYIRHFNGAVNIPKLSIGEVALYDIVIENPRFNVVQATPEVANYDIFPKSDDKEESSASVPVPSITFGTFRIVDDMPVRYFSLPDTTEVAVTLTTTRLEGADAPVYAVNVDGVTSASIPGISLENLRFGIGGSLHWDRSKPEYIGFDRFKFQVGDVQTEVSSEVNLGKELTIETLQLALPETKVNSIIALIPKEMRGELDKVTTDLSVAADMRLMRPYRPEIDSIPSFDLSLKVPEGKFVYDNLVLNRFALDAVANIDGDNLDKSKLDVKRLVAIGEGVGFELNATASDILSDPAVDGTFKGGVEIQRLPKKLLAKLPFEVTGSLRADSRFRFRKSYLDREEFHRIRLTGDACLKNFKLSMPELPAEIYARDVDLKLGTNSEFTRGDVSVDSLLTASLMIDTISAEVTGMVLQGRALKMGVGCRNIASSLDTTVVNPIGGRIVAERLFFKSEQDSMRVRLKDASVGALLRRFKGDKHKPQLALAIEADRAMYGDRLTRALLSDASVKVTVYPQTPRVPARMRIRMDSLRALYPSLPPDSIFRMALPKGRHRPVMYDSTAIAEGQVVDMEVDNSMRDLLRRWEARGSLQAKSVGVFTRMFPLRNRVSDLNIRFNSDSVIITDTRYRAGKSDFLINGTISNITRALTTASMNQRLQVNLNLRSDTIDVNEVAAAVFAGAAFMDSDTAGVVSMVADTYDEDKLQASVEAASDTMAVLVVPSNIEAVLDVKANTILYSDLSFRDFTGTLNVYNGAINLSQLMASTDIGSVDLNALYNAPSKREVSFAFGMQVRDFRVARFLNLVPAIDSLMPLLNDIDGIITADIAATTDLDSAMNIEIPTLRAAVKLSGDSLKVIDEETFRTIGKWLLFKHKDHNMIDHMNVEMIIDNSQLRMFPFMFYLDRYKLGVSGSNDLAMNLNYHIAVLKSPLPFKFGINITGNVDDMKIRLGRAKFNEKEMAKTVSIADTTRVNLVREIQNVFRRGVRNSKLKQLNFTDVAQKLATDAVDAAPDTLSHADSTYFIKEGLIPAPDTISATPAIVNQKNHNKKK